jgi:hypothetical protein
MRVNIFLAIDLGGERKGKIKNSKLKGEDGNN